MPVSRRVFLAGGAAAVIAGRAGGEERAEEVPVTGPGPALPSFDRQVLEFMAARQVTGGALAVIRNRKLVYARGYGWADRDAKVPVRPDDLFRIASVTKPITSAAVMRLVERGKLHLDQRAFELLELEPILEGDAKPDPRLQTITVRQLLEHTGGWDRGRAFDPMFRPGPIARAAGEPPPAKQQAIIRYMLGKPLQFDPGTRSAYSNFGYCVLGRIIHKVSGMPYDEYVQRNVLKPAGIKRMRLGASLASGKGEVHYYTSDNAVAPTVFPDHPDPAPVPYGAFYLEAMDSHGAWIASAVDLMRFAAALDEPAKCPFLNAETVRALYAPPAAPVARRQDGTLRETWYAKGWSVRPVRNTGRANYWHNGSLAGTNTLLVRRFDGLSWAVLFNLRSDDPKLPDGAIDGALHVAADAVKEWPDVDLFPRLH